MVDRLEDQLANYVDCLIERDVYRVITYSRDRRDRDDEQDSYDEMRYRDRSKKRRNTRMDMFDEVTKEIEKRVEEIDESLSKATDEELDELIERTRIKAMRFEDEFQTTRRKEVGAISSYYNYIIVPDLTLYRETRSKKRSEETLFDRPAVKTFRIK